MTSLPFCSLPFKTLERRPVRWIPPIHRGRVKPQGSKYVEEYITVCLKHEKGFIGTSSHRKA